uniref:Forkhead box J3 n=1 Tax=Cyprinodon variegatus TaxID=28743 RepID=A0A3Q2DT75_CYPVA
MELMRQAELNNWTLDATQMADLCSSINQFFTATGVIPPQTCVLQKWMCESLYTNPTVSHCPFICSLTVNMYMDSRQNISSLMVPPGYPHMPPMSNTAPSMTGHHRQLSQQQHALPPGHFQVRRMLAADDIQDDFDWDSIV